ncbi:MAG: hydroxymethylbilane synthase [Lautropia sp.]
MVDRQGPGQLTPAATPTAAAASATLPGAGAGATPAAAIPARLRIATRQSRLALWQAEHVAGLLRSRYPDTAVELVAMTTRGDQIQDRPLAEVGGKGLFTKELELALIDGRAELAVHSLKDVPMDLPDGFELVATLTRADPRDAFVSASVATIAELPAGAVIGTSSLRREAQLRERFPALRIAPVRGNLDTRLTKLDRGDYDGLVLAAAGLKRLGLAARIRELLPPAEMLPAPGQGVLGVEIAAGRDDVRRALAFLDDSATARSASAERAVSRQLGGNCRTPLAAYAYELPDGRLQVDALLADDAGRVRRASAAAAVADVAAARVLGERVAAELASG